MNILLTGCAGFIGSNLLKKLLFDGHRIIGVDNLSNGNKDNMISHTYFTFLNQDVCDKKRMLEILKDYKIEKICHQAAIGSVPRSILNPEISFKNNINGFNSLAIAAKDAGIKRFVYASSSSVYGDSLGNAKLECYIGTQLSPYAVSKRCNEIVADTFGKAYNMEFVGLRYFNVFGPNQKLDNIYGAVIPKFINKIKNNEEITIFGDGTSSRDYTYVDNVVNANVQALETSNYNEVYNIGCQETVTIKDLVNQIGILLNKNPKINYSKERKGDVKNSQATITKAQKFLNYKVEIPVNEGLKRYINDLLTK